jgi:hypothetical protein
MGYTWRQHWTGRSKCWTSAWQWSRVSRGARSLVPWRTSSTTLLRMKSSPPAPVVSRFTLHQLHRILLLPLLLLYAAAASRLGLRLRLLRAARGPLHRRLLRADALYKIRLHREPLGERMRALSETESGRSARDLLCWTGRKPHTWLHVTSGGRCSRIRRGALYHEVF